MRVDLAIKFGGHEIIIYRKGFGIIAKEPAYLAVTPIGKTFRVRAVGKEAERLQVKKSKNIIVYQPIKNSEVVDERLATILVRKMLENNIVDKFTIRGITALVAVPCALPIEQLLKLKLVLLDAGINRVNFVQNGVCIREYDSTLDPYASCLVVDIGKDTTDFSVLNKIAFIAGRDFSIGGQDMDNAIQTYIEDNYSLEITPSVAEDLKCKLGSLYDNDTYITDFSGINAEKIFETQKISASDVRIAIVGVYNKIFDLIKDYLSKFPKEISAEVYKNGVIFSGGSSVIPGLYEYATMKLDMPVISLDNPIDAVVLGCAKLLDRPLKSINKINF